VSDIGEELVAEAQQDPRVKRARRQAWIPVAIIAILGVLLSYFVIAQAIPAQPAQIYSSHVVEEEVCPLGRVHIVSKYEINDYDITYLNFVSTWQQVGQPTATQPGGQVTLDAPGELESVVRHDSIAAFVRTAPAQPGRWRLTTDVEVSFDVMGVPRVQEYTYETPGILTVIPLTSSQCQVEGGLNN
jgi:hypothetical protein